jgi:hypothetical protein
LVYRKGLDTHVQFGMYNRDPHTAVLHANGLMVLTLAGGQISAITRFDNSVLSWFGLPRTLPDQP